MTIRAVIFDLGHTIWDIAPGGADALDSAYDRMRETLVARLNRDDLPPAQALRRAVSDALREDADTYFTSGDVLEQPPTQHWVGRGLRSLGLELDEPLLAEVTPPLFATEIDRLICADGTVEAVHTLDERGVLLGCVTNTLADTTTIHRMLRDYDIHAVMRSVVVSSAEGYRKPHPSLFEKAAREIGVTHDEVIFVGDSPYHDVAGAKAVGMRAVLTRQYVTRPDVEGTPLPDAIITHLRELPALLPTLEPRSRRM